MGFTEVLKKAAENKKNSEMPAAIMYGVVVGESPLKIMVDGRFTIEGKQIIVPKEYQKGTYDTHKHKLFAHNPDIARTGKGIGLDGKEPPEEVREHAYKHAHELEDKYWTNDEGNSLTDREVYYGLAVGEKVILIRNEGGQEFLVAGRI